MAPHPLDGCFLKLARADAHLADLERTMRDIVALAPDRLPGEFDAQTGDYVFRAQRPLSVPLDLSGQLGDVVHNLRSALDYLAWELVGANSKIGTSATEFPIFQDRTDFAKRGRPKLRGMDPAAQRLIEHLQPFQTPFSARHPSEDPLAVLHALDIQDKHRALNLATYVLAVRPHGLPSDIHQPPGLSAFAPGAYAAGAVLLRLRGAGGGLSLWLEMRHGIVFDATSPAAGEEVLDTLRRLREYVAGEVLPRFAAFFPAHS